MFLGLSKHRRHVLNAQQGQASILSKNTILADEKVIENLYSLRQLVNSVVRIVVPSQRTQRRMRISQTCHHPRPGVED